jgi:hypothetical protein
MMDPSCDGSILSSNIRDGRFHPLVSLPVLVTHNMHGTPFLLPANQPKALGQGLHHQGATPASEAYLGDES